MIKKFEQFINEDVLTDIIMRDRQGRSRKEDKFVDDLNKIKAAGFIKVGDALWTPFNFGASEVGKPGKFMKIEEIDELDEYLKDTDYRISKSNDFTNLGYSGRYDKKTVNKISVISFKGDDDMCLELPNFGFISGYYEKNNEVEKPTIYGTALYFGTNTGYVELNLNNKTRRYYSKFYYTKQTDDKFQVRLIHK